MAATVRGTGTFAPYAGRRALVLGATGFIGRRVARLLAASGAAVHLVARDRRGADALGRRLGADLTVADLSDPDAIADLVRAVHPTITFNLAGYGIDRREREETAAYRINAELPALLAELLGTVRAPDWPGLGLVHAGSALEYGTATGDLNESTTPSPTTLYGQSKLEGTRAIEAHCRWSDLPAATARLFTVYGPGESSGRLLPALMEAARTRVPLDLTAGTQCRDFTYVDDVAEGMLRLGLARVEPGEAVNLATGRLISVREFAERAAHVLRMDPALLRFGVVPTRPEEMTHDPVTTARLRSLTGWHPATTIEEGVRATIESGSARGG